MAISPTLLLQLAGQGIGKAGQNKHMAGMARIALVMLALNSGQQSLDNHKILTQLSGITAHIDSNDSRITYLETVIKVAYIDSLNIVTPPAKPSHKKEAQHEHTTIH